MRKSSTRSIILALRLSYPSESLLILYRYYCRYYRRTRWNTFLRICQEADQSNQPRQQSNSRSLL